MTSLYPIEGIDLSFQDCVVKSGISPKIYTLNFEPVSARAIYDLLYRDTDPTTNSSSGSTQAKRNYAKCEGASGFIVNGRFRQLTGEPLGIDKKGRPRRYYQPQGKPLEVFCPLVTVEVWRSVAAKAGLSMPDLPAIGLNGEALGFWDWVIASGCPIVITEGEKKAAALISRGYAAVGLPGIHTGYRVTERGEIVRKPDGTEYQRASARELHATLQPLDTAGREITIVFDHRAGDYSQSQEFRAASTLAKLFKTAIAKIAILPGPHKGVDDFCVAGGDIDAVLSAAELFSKLQNECLWRMHRGFSPDILTNSRYFDTEAPKSGKITAIKSGLGTGKTEYLKNKVAADRTGVQINLTYRNSLGLQLAEKLNSYHLDAHGGYKMFANPDARLTLCVDSLLKIPLERLEGCTLIIDESASVIKHLLTSRTLFDKRLEVLERFELACQKADRIVLTDGHQADWVVSYISRLSGKAATKIQNLFNGDTPPVFFVTPEAGQSLKKFDEWYTQQILAAVCPAIATDSVEKAEAMAELLQMSHGEGILLTAKTVTEAWAKEFLADPDAYIREHQPAWLIYSPTAESGVDISILHKFSDVFCWFVGTIGVDECLQMSRRVRHPERITVFAAERGLGSSKDGDATYYKQISAAIEERVTAEALALTDEVLSAVTREAIAQQAQSPHHETYCKIKAKENFERRDLRGYLFKAFEAGGYAPQWVQAGSSESNEHGEAKQECRDKAAKQIFDADDIDLNQALEIERSYSASWAERCQAIKARLKARLPGIERSALWTWEFVRLVRFEDRALLNRLEASWLFKNQEDAEYLQRRKWKQQLRTFLPDISDRWLKLRLLKNLGIEQFLNPDTSWTADSPEVRDFIKRCKKKAVANVLGYPDKKAPMRYINRLLASIGVKLVAQQIREGSERVWSYRYQPEATTKLTPKGAQRVCSLPENWEILAELTAVRLVKKVEDLKHAELLEQQGFDVVTDEAINKQIQQSSVTVEPLPEQAERIGRTAWVQRWGQWVRGSFLAATDGAQYRMLIEQLGGWSEVLAWPHQIRWEAI
ncbi:MULTISPECIES: plasmid replication protein, CyRepA1 family [unclassified Microcoleus]|uniref:plasmid replication protein, CyRepA1 family n=1 Tax=unclassified Microcoleus TaxID=2642155 RepID=UPI002FD4B31D